MRKGHRTKDSFHIERKKNVDLKKQGNYILVRNELHELVKISYVHFIRN